MTVFWILAALLTAGVVTLLGRPLMRRAAADEAGGGTDLAVYRDQLAELERDRTRGVIEPDQAQSLEAEIGRRMLNAARAATPLPAATAPARRLTMILAVLFPLAALGAYLAVGRPDLPGQPLAERKIVASADPGKILAQVEQVRAGLKPVKEDLDRWVLIGEAYNKLGRPRDAIEAFRVAVGIDPQNTALSGALAEMLIAADGGAVGEEARQRFQAIPDDSPTKPEARYYLALADYQAGDLKAALKGWQSLLADSPADAGWIETTRAGIAAAAQGLGLDPAKETPTPKPPAPDEANAIAQMAPEQQAEMIRGMVGKLAAKLEANPDDAPGWRQLAHAYEVLGETDKAKAALDRAAVAEKAKP